MLLFPTLGIGFFYILAYRLCLVASWSSFRCEYRTFSSAVSPLQLMDHSHHIVQLESKIILDETFTSNHEFMHGIRSFLIASANAQDNTIYTSPTNTEIKLLRSALDVVYGEKNPSKALPLLSDAITAWKNKAPDERAALYRVRGDCFLVCYTMEIYFFLWHIANMFIFLY